ncbi:hypothetical protein OIO90_001748 [Microbotryomycetes sp. JL221]|nr:hypothetical protein OIO90_001748 [Microbotryomycetes sp. JL221]
MSSPVGVVKLVDISQCPTPQTLADAIKDAMQQQGFLFIKGHGLQAQVDQLFEISQDFFHNESDAEKQRCSYANNRGYTKMSQETLDPSNPAPDLKQGFNVGYIAPTEPPQPSHPLPNKFGLHVDKLCRFQLDCFAFCQRLLEAFAVILDLEPSFFTRNHKHDQNDVSILRFLHYPEVPPGKQVDPNRAGAHSDYGSLTLLFQRKNGGKGLQILPSTEPIDSPDSAWQNTGLVEDALLVNIGDALELWSGATFKSTLHRVRLPTPLPKEGIPERFSIAWFNQPAPNASLKTVVPTSSITEHDLQRMERKGVKAGTELTASQHLEARLASTYKLS